jgi:hypothetical protein
MSGINQIKKNKFVDFMIKDKLDEILLGFWLFFLGYVITSFLIAKAPVDWGLVGFKALIPMVILLGILAMANKFRWTMWKMVYPANTAVNREVFIEQTKFWLEKDRNELFLNVAFILASMLVLNVYLASFVVFALAFLIVLIMFGAILTYNSLRKMVLDKNFIEDVFSIEKEG